MDMQDKTIRPDLEDIGTWVRNPVFMDLCTEIMTAYQCKEQIEFSMCSMERGWNVKFKKAGKSLCTIYPREGYITVLVVVGKKEKEAVEEMLPGCTEQLREIYHQTREWNSQRWLMIDMEDKDKLYQEVLRLIRIRRWNGKEKFMNKQELKTLE